MAHGVLKRGDGKTGIGSRRIFAPQFKLQVLDSYRNDADCKGNQRATARKYGIHRRQIQKWLQVEGNLRNSVLKPREVALEHRQRDAAAGAEQEAAAAADKRVPEIPQPVFSSYEWQETEAFSPLDCTTRSRNTPDFKAFDSAAPIDLSLKPPRSISTPEASPRLPSPVLPVKPPEPSPCHPDIWDLSTKRPLDDAPCNSRPVKLFKPYLDNVIEEVHSPPAASITPPVIITNLDDYKLYHNNNNYQQEYQVDYTLCNDYFYQGGVHFVREPYPCVKQRQSYSVDFKLSAIECYYSDAVCRGNQRAVASKFKIHRRQVQKWLKQEDQLRQRVQPLHIVR